MSEESSVEQHLRHLEEKLLQPAVRKSPKDVAALLAVDFIEFGSSGNIFGKQQIIESLCAEESVQRSIVDFRVQVLAENVALVTYRASCYTASGEPVRQSLRSSLWKLIEGRWQLVFHQGTLLHATSE